MIHEDSTPEEGIEDVVHSFENVAPPELQKLKRLSINLVYLYNQSQSSPLNCNI